MEITVATPALAPTVIEIWSEAAAWLKEKGVDQWPSPPPDHWQRRMAHSVADGEVYLIGDGDAFCGMMRLTWEDDYWPDDGLAVYVHSVSLRTSVHGKGIGRMLLDWAADEARKRGRTCLRLDCRADNGRLRRYYEAQGFVFQTELTDHDYSAALYEKTL